MPFTHTPVVDGTAIQWSELETNRSAFHTWINTVPDADIQAAAVKQEHLARPTIAPFPINGMRSTFQAIAGEYRHGFGGDFHEEQKFASRHERMMFFPYYDCFNTGRLFLPVGKRVEVNDESRYIEAHCTFDYQSQATGSYYYPQGANTGTAGYFALFSRRVSSGVYTELNQSRQDAYSIQRSVAVTVHRDNFHLSHANQFAIGVYDIILGYVLGDTTSDLIQIDLTRIAFAAEVC